MSTSKKKGLGRGLTALFGDQKEEVQKKEKTHYCPCQLTKAWLVSINQSKICQMQLNIKKYQEKKRIQKKKRHGCLWA